MADPYLLPKPSAFMPQVAGQAPITAQNFWQLPETTMRFLDSSMQSATAGPGQIPTPVNILANRGDTLATAGTYPAGQVPTRPMSMLPPLSLLQQPMAQPIPEADPTSFFIPGQPGVAVPQAPRSTQLRKQMGDLKGPTEPLKGTPLESMMAGLGQARWDQMASTGTNLFNVGAAVAGASARSDKEERKAQEEYQRALQDFQLKKMQMESGLNQQDFENALKVQQQTTAQRAQTMLKPTFKDGMLIYGQPKDGGQQITVEKIAPTKEETQMKMLQQLSAMRTPDIQGAVLKGQVPGEISNLLMPKIMQAQQAIMTEFGGNLAMMDDVSKRQYMSKLVDMQLQNDPEIGPLIQKLIPELQQQQVLQSALK